MQDVSPRHSSHIACSFTLTRSLVAQGVWSLEGTGHSLMAYGYFWWGPAYCSEHPSDVECHISARKDRGKACGGISLTALLLELLEGCLLEFTF